MAGRFGEKVKIWRLTDMAVVNCLFFYLSLLVLNLWRTEAQWTPRAKKLQEKFFLSSQRTEKKDLLWAIGMEGHPFPLLALPSGQPQLQSCTAAVVVAVVLREHWVRTHSFSLEEPGKGSLGSKECRIFLFFFLLFLLPLCPRGSSKYVELHDSVEY